MGLVRNMGNLCVDGIGGSFASRGKLEVVPSSLTTTTRFDVGASNGEEQLMWDTKSVQEHRVRDKWCFLPSFLSELHSECANYPILANATRKYGTYNGLVQRYSKTVEIFKCDLGSKDVSIPQSRPAKSSR